RACYDPWRRPPLKGRPPRMRVVNVSHPSTIRSNRSNHGHGHVHGAVVQDSCSTDSDPSWKALPEAVMPASAAYGSPGRQEGWGAAPSGAPRHASAKATYVRQAAGRPKPDVAAEAAEPQASLAGGGGPPAPPGAAGAPPPRPGGTRG